MHSILSVESFNEVPQHSATVDGVGYWSFPLLTFACFCCAKPFPNQNPNWYNDLNTCGTEFFFFFFAIQSTEKHTDRQAHNNEMEMLTTEIKREEKKMNG